MIPDRNKPIMDFIIIEDLEVSYHVGISESERANAQRLLLTLEIEHDLTAAIAGDSLADTVDYNALSRRLVEFGEGCHWSLIETLAADIITMVQEEFHVDTLTVTVKKFVISQANHVAVRLKRSRRKG